MNQQDHDALCAWTKIALEKDARIAALEAMIAEIRRITIEDEPFGAVVETLFYAPLREAESEVRELRAKLADVVDAIFGVGVSVIGLPCVCETPELHSDACVQLRVLASRFETVHKAAGEQR